MKWILERLKERNTYLGLITILTTFGVTLSPEMVNAIISAGVAVAGLVLVFFKDDSTKVKEKIDSVTVEKE